jgi:hypothetical protein
MSEKKKGMGMALRVMGLVQDSLDIRWVLTKKCPVFHKC